MHRVLIEGCKHLMGNPMGEIEKIPMFDLQPGDKIKQIGRTTDNGKFSSSCRLLKLTTYVTYSGVWTCEEDQHLAFKINPDEVDGLRKDENVYMLFDIVHDPQKNHTELIRYDYDKDSIHIYQLNFEKYTEAKNKGSVRTV